MRGNAIPLPEVILQDTPEVLDLLCHEEIEVEEEVEPIIVQPYEVQVTCGLCEERIRFYVAATSESIRSLQQLLLEDLRFCCRRCALNCNHD